MERIRERYSLSIMSYITLSLISIIGIGLVTIFTSFWVTELADKDAQAINLSGSMRMQTYHIAFALERKETESAQTYIEQLDHTWAHSLFAQQRKTNSHKELNHAFDLALNHWTDKLRPALITISKEVTSRPLPINLLEEQVQLTNQLVEEFQLSAESKIRTLRLVQLFALFITIGVGSLIFYLIKNRIEKPLQQLTDAAHLIGKGNYGHQTIINGRDELSLLGAVINQMSTSIQDMYEKMDDRVKKRTLELRHNNKALAFLFNTARKTLDSHNNPLNFQELLNELATTINTSAKLELCLFTATGDKPYMHIFPKDCLATDCSQTSCKNCEGNAPFSGLTEQTLKLNQKFPIIYDEHHYGVINIRSEDTTPLPVWQEQLLSSIADQFALALSLNLQKEQDHRLAMLNERTVIARELHDSLAQSLSYLQIQVSRLQKSKDQEKYDQQQPIIDELREGLSSAYRQLRELLTTFRLKIDAGGLLPALETTVDKLKERSNMDVTLHYQLSNIPLSPTEEIHLLQIVREASQNALNHSHGKHLEISLQLLDDQHIELVIEDDGIGIHNSPEKLNHYGLAIMKERSRHLGSEVVIKPGQNAGTRVSFSFKPSFLN